MSGPQFLRFVDDAHSTVRLNLNDPTGWLPGEGMDLGVSGLEHRFLRQEPFDGAEFLPAGRQPIECALPLILMPQTSFANMKTLYDALAVELDRATNNLEYRPQGASASYFAKTYRADIPSLRNGAAGPSPFAVFRRDALITIRFFRDPQFTGAGAYI